MGVLITTVVVYITKLWLNINPKHYDQANRNIPPIMCGSDTILILDMCYEVIRLVPAQDGPFFYTRSQLRALQNCALLFSINF